MYRCRPPPLLTGAHLSLAHNQHAIITKCLSSFSSVNGWRGSGWSPSPTLKKHRQTLRHRGSPTHRHPPGYISLESARPSSPRINSWIFSRRCEDEWNFSEVFLFLIDSMTNNLFPVCYERTAPCRDAHNVVSYHFCSRIGFYYWKITNV